MTENKRFASLKWWLDSRKLHLFWYFLGVSLVILLLWPHTVITIAPGHVGVHYKRFFGGTDMSRIYPEGTHLIFPWDTLFLFDARVKEETHTFNVLTSKGLLLDIDVSVRYYPLASKTPILLTTVGQDYREKLILPTLSSAVRGIASHYDKEDFYSKISVNIQDEIHVSMVGALGRKPVIVDRVLLRAIRLPEPVNLAINEKFVAEQEVLRQGYKVLEAKERFKIKLIDAEAVRVTQDIVNKNMTEPFLRWQGIEATRALAGSSNSKMVVVGGKDGLPLILNPDGALPGTALPPAPTEILPPANGGRGQEGKSPAPFPGDGEAGYLKRIGIDSLHESLSRLDRLFKALSPGVTVGEKPSPPKPPMSGEEKP
ncbi:MAG: prohibitin family protein [Deltaproteobacteria bacterium]|nr:prohibitin family protein [Deltaproteobacteria bacterium]